MPILGVMGSVRAFSYVRIESPPTTSQYLSLQSFAHICHRLAGITASIYSPQIQIHPPCHPVVGLGLTYGVEHGINRNAVPTFLFDFRTHYRPILHRLVTTRQTDRAIGTGRLCRSICGLITLKFLQIPRSALESK